MLLAATSNRNNFLSMSYFLSIGQEFDIVINVDGFNEIYFASVNAYDNVSYSMPASFIYKRKTIDLLTGTNNVKRHIAKNAIDNCFFSSCFLSNRLLSLYYKLNHKIAQANYYYYPKMNEDAFYNFHLLESNKHRARPTTEPSSDELLGTQEYAKDLSIYNDTVNLWRNASIHMKHLSDLHKIQYIHVIQPNQWHRPTSPDKYEKLFDHKTIGTIEPFAVESRYPLLLDTAKTLENDVRIVELTTIFDEIPSAQFKRIYRDDCCHFTET